MFTKKTEEKKNEKVSITFADVKGIEQCKKELEEVVNILKHRAKYDEIGAKIPRGILLTGEPGTGKTLLAKAIAGESKVSFFNTSGAEFDEVYVGVGAKRIRDLFSNAKKMAPSIIFIDEIDSIGESRKNEYSIYHKQSLNQLLVEMDGFDTSENVIVIAATNMPEKLDSALKRPGRFDKVIDIPIPSLSSRKEILDLHLSKIRVDYTVNSSEIAKNIIGFTGADIANLTNTAMQLAVKAGKSFCSSTDIENAKDRILLGVASKSTEYTKDERMATALYEAGKVIAILYTEGADPLYKSSILKRGKTLGKTSQIPDIDKVLISKKQALASIDIKIAGKVMHELYYPKNLVSSAGEQDLASATSLVHRLIRQGLFEDLFGIVYFQSPEDLGPMSKNVVDASVKVVMNERRLRVRKLLQEKMKLALRIAEELVEKETLTSMEIAEIVKNFGKLA